MPRAPTYDSAQVSSTITPFVPQNDAGVAQLANATSGPGQEIGKSLMHAGDLATNIAIDMQDQANQVQLNDAANKARRAELDLTFNTESGFRGIKGEAATKRPDGKALPDEYAEKFQTTLGTIAEGLGNDAQRRAFSMQSNDMLTRFKGEVESHMLTEFRSHALSVQDGTIKIGVDTAKLNWENPLKIAPAINSVKGAVVEAGRLNGEAASETMAKLKVATSSVHMGVIESALQNSNPEYALDYIDKNKDGMTADDLLRARGVVNKDAYERVADGTATQVIRDVRAKFTPTDSSRVVAITRQSESGGNRDAVGRYIPGQGTAKGDMQVMDATAAKPGHGIKPADPNNPADRSRVGEQLIGALVTKYAGDVSKAWAAYNWGEGNVDKAIKTEGANWLAGAPKETQNYVAKNVAALGAGGGAPAKPTLQDVHDNVRARITERFGATPPAGVMKMALASATNQFEDLNKSIKADEEERTTAAMRALQQNGGRYSALPFAVRAAIPPDKVDNVLAFGQRIAKGDDITNNAVFQRLSDPKVLAGLSDNQFYQMRTELSEADFKHFSTQRMAAQGKTGNKLEEVNTGALNSVLANHMQISGMDPSPKDGTEEAQRVGAIKKHVVETMLAQQKLTGKQMTDADVENHINGLFAKSVAFRSSFMGIDTGVSRDRMLTMRAGDIPGDTKDALKRDFKAAGYDNPTDADLLGAYWRIKSLPSKPTPGQSASGKIKPKL